MSSGDTIEWRQLKFIGKKNLRRIPLYNGVNLTEGYGPIAIHTPPEVVFYEEGV